MKGHKEIDQILADEVEGVHQNLQWAETEKNMCGAKESDLDPREAQWKRWRWMAPAPPGAQQHHGEDDQPYRTVQHEEEVACRRIAWGPPIAQPR